ncbi:MAG: FtsX-like permease family protein [Actinoplanes sp.]
MRAVLRRVRAYGGHLGLLAALGLVAALLAGGVPRLANEYTDRGLQGDVARLPFQVRDLTLTTDRVTAAQISPATAAGELPSYEDKLPGALPSVVEDRWFSAKLDPPQATFSGPAPHGGICPPQLRVRHQSGYDRAVRIVEGRLPRSRSGVEVVVSREAVELVSLRMGSVLTIGGGDTTAELRVVGVFEPADPGAAFWADQRTGPVPCPNPTDGTRYETTLLTDLPGITLAGPAGGGLTYDWRFRVAAGRLTAADTSWLTTAVVTARRTPPGRGIRLATGLDGAMTSFDREVRGARAVLGVVQAGLLATMAGLLLLAALLMVDRRREEFALLRARGGTPALVGRRTLAETLLVVPVAVLAGWLLSLLLPGRTGGLALPLVVGPAVVATLAAPVLAARSHGRAGRPGRPSARRLTAEVFVVLLAGLGVVLVRQRGLAGGVDPFLALVPVLLAAAGALVAVRLLPLPLQQLGRTAGRARGVVPFLGLARAGRGAPINAGPLAVLVVALATGVFTAAVSGTVGDARDRATDQEIAADLRVLGASYSPQTTQRLGAVPGVTAIAPLIVDSGAPLTTAAARRTQAQLLVVDGAAAGRVMAASGVGGRLPAALTGPRAGGPVPAIVSPEIAAEVGPTGVVTVQGRRYDFRVAGVAESLPALEVGARRFIAVPWQALPVPDFQPLIPNRYLIAGDPDPAALRTAGDAGQREYLGGVLGHPVTSDAALGLRTSVTTWAAHRESLEESGVNGVLSFTFAAGAAGAVALALLAVALTVLADAPGRGHTLSRLRTMGLSLRQGRRLFVYELVPLLAVAVLTGGLVGVALPALIGPALGLDGFTAGIATRTHVDPWLPVAALLLVAAALALAVAVESLVNRRMRLGTALRLGEEN